MVTNMGENQIIRVTSTDPSDPFVKEVNIGRLQRDGVDAYELEDGRVLHKNTEGRDVSVEILGYTAPPKGTMVVSWVDDDKDEYFGVYASRTDSYRGHTREGKYGVLLVVNGLVDCPWKVIA